MGEEGGFIFGVDGSFRMEIENGILNEIIFLAEGKIDFLERIIDGILRFFPLLIVEKRLRGCEPFSPLS